MNVRVGIGYDVHRLEKGNGLIIGGITIPSDKKSIGHSDADVLIHAIMDALLGAAALRDIGVHFPDTDNSLKNVDSKKLLKKVVDILKEKRISIINIDTVVCLQSPKISPYISKMQETLSKVMNLDSNRINIKATTTEKLGFIGKGEGISAQAVCLLSLPE